jgi:hypothetical protein
MDITPARDGLWLGGHGKTRRSRGVRDPLCVRSLYLSQANVSVSLSCLDLIGLRKVHVDQIRERLTETLPSEGNLVFTTHTHDAPDTLGYWGRRLLGLVPLGSGIDPAYMEHVQTRTADCIRAAKERAVPVRAFAGREDAPKDLTRNLRREGYKEDRVLVLLLRDETGHTVAVLSNYPCHPQVLGRDNQRVSAEFLTDLHKKVESRLGGVSIFIQNALGGMVTGGIPEGRGKADLKEKERFIEYLGRTLGEIVVKALEENAEPLPGSQGLRFTRREFAVPLRNRKMLLAARRGFLPATPEEIRTRQLTTETSLIELGPVRMVTLPGEALPELGFHIQNILDCPYPFVLCMGCDELGYILPRDYARNPGYRYENSMSVSPDLAELLLEQIQSLRSYPDPAE